MLWKTDVRAFAEPYGEAALFGNGGKGEVSFAGAQREFLAAGFPAEFFDKEFGEITILQKWTGAGDVEWHSYSSGTWNPMGRPFFSGGAISWAYDAMFDELEAPIWHFKFVRFCLSDLSTIVMPPT